MNVGTMEWPSGPPLGAATQSTGRPMGENGISRPAPLNNVRRVPPNNTNGGSAVRHGPSISSSLSSGGLLSAGQVVALAREAMRNALDENQTKAADASEVSNELKPGVTIDLSHKSIQRFPEEVVDIIKHELERYYLSCPTEHKKRDTADPSLLGLHCHTTKFPVSPLGFLNAPPYDI